MNRKGDIMYTLILVMWVQYANTSIDISQALLPGRYKDNAACESAGQTLFVRNAPDSPAKAGVGDLRVGYICVPAATEKPLGPS